MADNDELNKDTNDEYQFSELDPLDSSMSEAEDSSEESQGSPRAKKLVSGTENHVKRNALIAVGLFLVFMMGYKFVGAYLTGTKSEASDIKQTITPTPIPVQQPAVVPSQIPTTPVQPSLPVSQSVSMPDSAGQYAEMKSNLSSLVVGQENINTQVATFNNQFEDVESKINQLTDQVSKLNQIITGLNDKLENQAKVIEHLSAKQTNAVARQHRDRGERRVIRYYIQAVIPGRAWIVSQDGDTLTVREGSRVPGYGMVRLIDPNQGRVLTSSGLVIRFSQEDS